jgi:hypothetical protein
MIQAGFTGLHHREADATRKRQPKSAWWPSARTFGAVLENMVIFVMLASMNKYKMPHSKLQGQLQNK